MYVGRIRQIERLIGGGLIPALLSKLTAVAQGCLMLFNQPARVSIELANVEIILYTALLLFNM